MNNTGLHNYHFIPKVRETELRRYVNNYLADNPKKFVIASGIYIYTPAIQEITIEYTTVKNQSGNFIPLRFTFLDEFTEDLTKAELGMFVLEGILHDDYADLILKQTLTNIQGAKAARDWIKINI